MAARLQKSTEAEKFRFLNIALEKKYTSQIDILTRQQKVSLSQIFRERRKIEVELEHQRNARLTDPIPFHLRGGGNRIGAPISSNIRRNSASPESQPGMRRSVSEGDLLGLPSGISRAQTLIPPVGNTSSRSLGVSSKRRVRFEDDPVEKEKEETTQQRPNPMDSSGHRTADVILSPERLFDSTRALAVYRRLQRKVQDSLEHGNNSRNPEAAVESTMKLMKRRQQRKMREEQAEAAKNGGKRPNSGPEQNAAGPDRKVTGSSTKKRSRGWRTPDRREHGGGRSTSREAYRLPSFTMDDGSLHLHKRTDDDFKKLEGRKMMERENDKVYFGKIKQAAENKRVTKKIDDYLAKY
nr:uncharacterized protein LOC129258293 [Lytechinus pictus]